MKVTEQWEMDEIEISLEGTNLYLHEPVKLENLDRWTFGSISQGSIILTKHQATLLLNQLIKSINEMDKQDAELKEYMEKSKQV
jgi:hypothetical protein